MAWDIQEIVRQRILRHNVNNNREKDNYVSEALRMDNQGAQCIQWMKDDLNCKVRM